MRPSRRPYKVILTVAVSALPGPAAKKVPLSCHATMPRAKEAAKGLLKVYPWYVLHVEGPGGLRQDVLNGKD